ncbi:MAG TPA: peptide ABC transporter permease, partial [Roseiflexaceae bacterium]|nr:peptide ABC transporter permease [Roseiflexaceae bacterium]
MSAVVPNNPAAAMQPATETILARPPSNLWRDAGIRFSKNKLAMTSLLVVLILLFLSVIADVIAPNVNVAKLSDARLFPGQKGYILGTDDVGRDMLKRLIHGTRTSLLVGLSVQCIALVIG